jgi:hypothetical protein
MRSAVHRAMTRQVAALLLTMAVVASTASEPAAIEPDVAAALTQYLRFSPSELADLQKGKVVRHGVDASAPGEIAVVGAVRVAVPPAKLIDGVRDIADFKRGPDVLEIGRFSDPPSPRDLDRLTVNKEDFDAGDCHVGDCGVRLPADAIRRLPREVNSAGPDAQERAARWFKETLFNHVNAYWSGAPGRITSYDDGSQPIRPANDSAALLKNAPTIGALFPSLAEHLARFPSQRMDGEEDFLYWSKEKFGIAPFITVTHVTIACRSERSCMVASKDVYSSRYIDASLALTIASGDLLDKQALYLVYSNRSRANALKGHFSGLRRAIAERRARSGLEETLKSLKRRLESAR